ncbi:MAG: M56 family metallopeptidase [Daejeonella sp.]
MNIFYYLLEANSYLLGFYVFYKLVLQNETFNLFNRYYLLVTSVISFIMPGIVLSGLHRQREVEYNAAPLTENVPEWSFIQALPAIYLVVSACFLLRLLYRLYSISQLINRGTIKTEEGFRMVSVNDKSLSFSFMHYLFVNPATEQAETIIRHELVHIRQWHSADILFFEVLQITSWFNPFIHFIQKDIRSLHEFIADEETSELEKNAGEYALFLISHSYGARQNDLANTMFNQSLLKRRIMKLNQEKSSDKAALKYLLAPILLSLMLCATAITFAKPYGIIDLMPGEEITLQDTSKKKLPPPPPEPPKASGKVDKSRPPAPPMPPKKVTKRDKIAPPPPPEPPKQSGTVDKELPPPPPAPPKPKVGVIKFPPPVVIPASKKKSTKPAKQKIDKVRFPAPVIVPASGKKVANAPKIDKVKFPPPIVEPKP